MASICLRICKLAGHYKIDAEKTGFKVTSQTGVEVQLQQASAIAIGQSDADG
jgi:hypothetical protein